MELHEILRKIRRDRELTQENLAEELKIDVTTYNRYEKDGSQIRHAQLEQLAKFYEITLIQLLTYGSNDNQVSESVPIYGSKTLLSVTIQLDGTKDTLDRWLSKLKKVNAALS